MSEKESADGLDRYCVVCGRMYGPALNACCTASSLVATKTEGIIRKRRVYFTLDGHPVSPSDLERLRAEKIGESLKKANPNSTAVGSAHTHDDAPGAERIAPTNRRVGPQTDDTATPDASQYQLHRLVPDAMLDVSEDGFFRSCFDFGNQITQAADDRTLADFPALATVRKMLDSGASGKALELASECLKEYSDCDIPYIWKSNALRSCGHPREAEQVLLSGLTQARRKDQICSSLGESARKLKRDREAVGWWVRACIFQLRSSTLDNAMPFVNLAYVALHIRLVSTKDQGLPDLEVPYRYFLTLADRADARTVRFNDQGDSERNELARRVVTRRDVLIPTVLNELARYRLGGFRSAAAPGGLMKAAAGGSASEVQELIDQGATIDERNAFGNTPLHEACSQGHLLVVATLLDAGADPFIENDMGRSAYERTVSANHPSVLSLLQSRGRPPGVE